MVISLRGVSGIRSMLSGGGGGVSSSAIVPMGKESQELRQMHTREGRYMQKMAPQYGKLDRGGVVKMAAMAEQAQVQLVLFQEANKAYAKMAQVASQTHAAYSQQHEIAARADQSFQRTNTRMAQAGFKHGLLGGVQEAQMSAWQGRKMNAKAALYG